MLYFNVYAFIAAGLLTLALTYRAIKRDNNAAAMTFGGLFVLIGYVWLGAAASQSTINNLQAQLSADSLLDATSSPDGFMAPQWFHDGLLYVGGGMFVIGLTWLFLSQFREERADFPNTRTKNMVRADNRRNSRAGERRFSLKKKDNQGADMIKVGTD